MREIYLRRSVRKYKKDQISEEIIKKLLNAAMCAPSALNEQPWEFIVVDDETLLDKISQFSNHSSFVKTAPLAVVVLANLDKVKSTLYHQDLAACTQNLMLEAVTHNLGTCWLGTYPKEDRMSYVKNLFNLPDNIEPFSIIVVGYPEDPTSLKEVNRYNENVIHKNRW